MLKVDGWQDDWLDEWCDEWNLALLIASDGKETSGHDMRFGDAWNDSSKLTRYYMDDSDEIVGVDPRPIYEHIAHEIHR